MFQIGVDIGGTFTDCVVLDEHGRRTLAKAFSTPADPSHGVFDALGVAARELGLELSALLGRASAFVHGCVVARNAVIERNGAPTALMTTRGHEDSIFIGRVYQKRAGLADRDLRHSSRLNRAEPPIVEPRFVRGISERVDADGEVVVALDPAEADQVVDELVGAGVTAVAICFLWSFLNPTHERTVRDRIAKRHPELFVSLSSDVAPLLGEYERAVTTILSAYLGPCLANYLEGLERRLGELGYRSPLYVMQASGGLTTANEAAGRAVLTLDAGPVGGTLGAGFYGRQYGEANLLCTDVGGTSFDVSLVFGGEPQLEPEPVIDQYAFNVPKVLVKSVSSGGGSIAWLDRTGILRVGPSSAGSTPGPACYGRGGTQPTVTDASLVLGYLNPSFFLGGRLELDVAAAERALTSVADPLRLNVVEAAAGIFKIGNAQMADLVRQATIERGFDPRDFLLFSYGGAGSTHAAFYAEDVEAKGIVVLAESAVFSAFGLLTADLAHSAESSLPMRPPFTQEQFDDANRLLDGLQARVLATFAREGVEPAAVKLGRTVSMRSQLQTDVLDVALPDRRLSPLDSELLESCFAERHRAMFGEGAILDRGGIELASFRVTGAHRALATPVMRQRLVTGGTNGKSSASRALLGTRRAYFEDARGFVDTAVYDGDGLRDTPGLHPGDDLLGPAIVERMGDTVVVPPGFGLLVDEFRNLRIARETV